MLLIHSPLEHFEVFAFANIERLGYILSFTNFTLYAIILTALLVGVHVISSSSNGSIIPNKWELSLEAILTTVANIVKEQIGPKGSIYLPITYAIFIYILIANLFGNIPYSFTLFTSAIASLGISFTIFIAVTITAVYRHGIHFFSFFVPAGTPGIMVPRLVLIELISYLARAFSLGVRLFANLVAGHTLLKILSSRLWPIMTSSVILAVVSILPLVIFTALVGLELAVSFIQAYVFVILTCVYIRDALDLH